MKMDNILETLARQTLLLNNLDPEEVISVLKCCESHTYQDGETIYVEGSKGNNLFIVLKGAVRIKKNNNTIDIMRIGDCFGEIGAVSNETRIYTTEAYGEVLALSISGAYIDTLNPNVQIKVLKNLLFIISERFTKRLS